jgi:hypothetical protein
VQRLQLQYATTNSSSAIPAVRTNGLRSDCIDTPALGASRPLPLISATPAMRRLFNDSGASPSRALGAHVSTNEVPGGGPPCHTALQVTRRGECPDFVRGPDTPLCGGLEGTPSRALGAHVSINEVPGSGTSHALRVTGCGECLGARTEGLGTPHCQHSRAVGAFDSINGVPGGGPSCHNAFQINRRGEGPGLRGPAPSLCGLSDQALSALVSDSTGGMLGGGVPPCHHAVPSTRGGECSGLTRGPSTPYREDQRLALVSDDSIGKVPGSSGSVRSHALADHKVLRFWQAGHCSSPRLTRSNRDLSHGRDLAVKGDALIHRPCLVAGLVGSEWRTRRPV